MENEETQKMEIEIVQVSSQGQVSETLHDNISRGPSKRSSSGNEIITNRHRGLTSSSPCSNFPTQILATEEDTELILEHGQRSIDDQCNGHANSKNRHRSQIVDRTTDSNVDDDSDEHKVDATVIEHVQKCEGSVESSPEHEEEPLRQFEMPVDPLEITNDDFKSEDDDIKLDEKPENDQSVDKKHKDSDLLDPPLHANGIALPFSFPGQSFSIQSQQLILNVWDFFKRARKDPKLIHSLRGPQDHASAALNVGAKTIGKIAKRVLRLGKLETPGKKRNRPKTILDSIDAEGEKVLRQIILEMYDQNIAPTTSLVFTLAKERLGFKGSPTSLRRVLKRMGYKYGGLNNTLIKSENGKEVSGWKEKPAKKSKKIAATTSSDSPTKKKERKKPTTPNGTSKRRKKQLQHFEVIDAQEIEIIEAHDIIEAHEMMEDEILEHEVIIHYQKDDDNNHYLSQSDGQMIAVTTDPSEEGQMITVTTTDSSTDGQLITVTGDPSDVLQLQLNSDGEAVPVAVVHQWNFDEDNNPTITLGVESL